jgi:3-oxoacyl-[acyl-carrier-protein] synthase II
MGNKVKAVITGIGIVSPVGIGRESFWNALLQGRTGFVPITLFDTTPFPVKRGGEISGFDPAMFLGKKGLRELDRSTRLLCSAAKLAIDDAGLQITDESGDDIGVSVGSTFGSLHSIFQFDTSGLIDGPRYVNPSHFPNTVINSPASHVSIRFGVRGFNTTISTGFCSGLDSLIYASDFIGLKRAGAVITGAVEELCEETFFGFYRLGCLSGSDGSDPICCPFDARRNGVVISEAAAVLMIEDRDQAEARGASVLAEVLGYGNAFDPGNGSFSYGGEGLKRAIRKALEDASLASADIDYVSASANSTQVLDRMEAEVIGEVFGQKVRVSAIKSMIGETYSASGALSLAAAVGAICSGFIPPTVNYSVKDPECGIDCVSDEARRTDVRRALVITSDPYGHNSAVILGKFGMVSDA